MMKQVVFGGALAIALGAATAWAQGAKPAPRATTTQGEGHTAPKSQPNTAPDPTVPGGDLALGTVSLR